MNFFIDAYDLFIKAIAYIIGFPFTETFILTFSCYYILKKLGKDRFLWIRLRSLMPITENDEGPYRNKKFRYFNDILSLSLVFLIGVWLPLAVVRFINMEIAFYKDYVYERTDSKYKLERDVLLETHAMVGLPLFPYVWIPVVVGINKYRQWVDVETMVTWKFHDSRRKCFWSGYEDSSCGYAMDMARALHRDDESLSIGKKYVEARKPLGGYSYCSALSKLKAHATETEDVELYKEMVKRRCEQECRLACEKHKYIQSVPDYKVKRNFRSRADPESFL